MAELFADAVIGLAVALLQGDHQPGQRRLQQQQHQGQTPFHRQHQGGDHQQGHHIGKHADGATAKDFSQRIHIAGQPGQQLADRGAVVKAQREIQGVAKQVHPQPCGEPLADGLHQKALAALQRQAEQHRCQQQSNQASQGCALLHGLQPAPGVFSAQHSNHLAHQQGLYGQRAGERQQQQ